MKFLRILALLACLLITSAPAVTVTGNTSVPIPTLPGYAYKVLAAGTWGGATVTLQTLVAGAWVNIPGGSYTADFETTRVNGSGTQMQAVVSNAGATSLTITLTEVTGGAGAAAVINGVSDVPGLETALNGKPNNSPSMLFRADTLPNGTLIEHATTMPEIGTAFRYALANGGVEPDASSKLKIIAGALEAQGAGAMYLGTELAADDTVNSLTLDLEVLGTGGANNRNGLTIALAPTRLINGWPTVGQINLPAGMLHIQVTVQGITNFGVGTGGAAFTEIFAENATEIAGIYPWVPGQTGGGSLSYGKRFIMTFEFEGDECRITCYGKTYRFKNAAIAAAAGRYWWVESAGNTAAVGEYWRYHRIWVNGKMLDGAPGWGSQQAAQVLSDLSGQGPTTLPQQIIVNGGIGYLATDTPSVNPAILARGNVYASGKFQARPWAGYPESSAVLSGPYSTAESSSVTTQTLATGWVNLSTVPLANVGDSGETIIRGNFPNGNTKEVAVDITGTIVFTTGSLAETGPWELTILRQVLSVSKTNQLHFKFVSNSRTLLGFADLTGTNPPRIRCLAPTANGDVVVRCVVGSYTQR